MSWAGVIILLAFVSDSNFASNIWFLKALINDILQPRKPGDECLREARDSHVTNLISCPSMPSGSFPTVVVLDDVINVHRRELPLSAFYRSSTTSVYIYIFKCISKFIVSLRKGQYLLLSIAIFALRNHWNSLSQIAFILRNTSVFFSCWYNTTFISKHKYILFKKLISTRFIYCFAMLLYVRI